MKTPQRGLDNVDIQVAARLRMRRLQLGLEPRLLDIVIREPIGTIEKVEEGERRLGAAQLFRLTHILNVDVNYFFIAELKEDLSAYTAQVPIDNRALLEAQRFLELYISVDDEDIRAKVRALVASLSGTLPRSDSGQ